MTCDERSATDVFLFGRNVSAGRNFIGPYQLVRLIRSGTTTQVWEALEMGQKDRIALKLLHRDYHKDRKQIDELKHEADVGSTLNHDNVIKIFGYHDEHGIPLLAMQLFPARNLKIEMRENSELVAINARSMLTQCTAGLQHLHDQGWIHCDVKPDNFLSAENCVVKLIDFSIAEKPKRGLGAMLGGKRKTTRGTRSYMAPEQIRKQKLDFRTDIYGLGCLMFELLAGRTPFTASNPDELLKKHLKSPVPSLESCSGASLAYSDLVSRMLAKAPEARPESMHDVGTELSRMQVFKPGRRPDKKKPDDSSKSDEN